MNRGIRPRVSIGLLIFIFVMISMIFLAAPLQFKYKMWGMALTEIILLAWAIIPAIILKWDFKKVFPMRIPSWRQVFGSLVLWFGAYISVIVVSLIISYFFPQGMTDVSNFMVEFFGSVSFPLRFFILAIMPAVCEEILHRGFILYSFKNTSKWTSIISLGLIFGLFHMDPYRFLGTAILGLVFTYVMVETRNILLPMLLHFVNNSLSALSTLSATASADIVETPLASMGVFLLMAAVVPFLFLGGSRLLLPKEERKNRPIAKRTWVIVITMTSVLALGGVAVTAIGGAELLAEYNAEPVFESSFSQDVMKDTPDHRMEFSVEIAKTHSFDLSIQGEEGVLTRVTLENSQSGEEMFGVSAGEMTQQGTIYLAPGDYTIIISFLTVSQEALPVSVDVLIK